MTAIDETNSPMSAIWLFDQVAQTVPTTAKLIMGETASSVLQQTT